MANIVVSNETATPLGLWDTDAAYHVVPAMGDAVLDPDKASLSVLDALQDATAMSAPAAPSNTAAPVASGDAVTGETVSVTGGTWTGNPTPVLTYQWQVNDSVWGDIEGETAAALVLIEDYEGHNVRCIVTATNAVGDDSEPSNDLGPVTAPG